jgi:hypothetical protein
MDLFEVHKRIRQAFNKDMSGYLTAEEIDRALDRAQLQEFRHLYGDDRMLPNAPLSYGMTLKIHTDLNPFKKSFVFNQNIYNQTTNPTGTGPSGILILPSDFVFFISIRRTAPDAPIKVISEDEIAQRLSSTLRGPTFARPIAIINGPSDGAGFELGRTRIQIFPQAPVQGIVHYLSRPRAPLLAGTLSGRTFQYNVNGSVQLQWADTAIDRIIERALSILGETLKDELGPDNYKKARE